MTQPVSLRQRLRIAVLLPAAIAVGVSCAVFVLLQWRSSLAGKEERLRSLALMLSESSAATLAFSSPEDAAQVLRSLRGEPAIENAVLYDRDGAIFASYQTPRAKREVPRQPEPPGLHWRDGELVLYHPVTEGESRYGTLFLRWDLRPWYAEMRAYIFVALAILVSCLAAAIAIGNTLQRSITRPIRALATTAEAIARQRNYALRAEVPATVELATLAESFNLMLRETQGSQVRLAAEAEATRRAEQQLRLIMNATPGLISYIGVDGRYRFVNQTYAIWFGKRQEEIVGRTMKEVLGENAFARLEPHFRHALAGEGVEFELEAPYDAGGTRWVHAHYLPHRDSNGSVAGVVVLVLDITERRGMEASLAQAHAELERYSQKLEETVDERTARMREVIGELEAFSYSMAHDMRAPLRSMQGFSRLLLEEHAAGLDAEAQDFLRRIAAAAERLDRLTRDVLNYSSVVRQELPMEVVDTRRLLEEIISTYPNLQAPYAEVRLEGQIPPLWANMSALTQVIANLLGNAVKFVAPGVTPVVRVSAGPAGAAGDDSAPQENIRLSFRDNGIGIPPELQSRLFSMFQRLHRGDVYEGTGMGLAIVRKAVERMGGNLGVDSEEGRGSCFWVELRAGRSGAEEPAPASPIISVNAATDLSTLLPSRKESPA